jgi:hypothetical protein
VNHDGGTAVFDQPFSVIGHDAVIDAKVGVKLGKCCGHDALPLDAHNDVRFGYLSEMGLGERSRNMMADTVRMPQTNHANLGFGSRLERIFSGVI